MFYFAYQEIFFVYINSTGPNVFMVVLCCFPGQEVAKFLSSLNFYFVSLAKKDAKLTVDRGGVDHDRTFFGYLII